MKQIAQTTECQEQQLIGQCSCQNSDPRLLHRNGHPFITVIWGRLEVVLKDSMIYKEDEETECKRLTENLPRLGLSFPAKIFKAVLFPIPLVPTKPSTSPGLGIGNLQNE